MPELARFLGLVVVMYYNNHPPAHFHAKYGGYEVTVRIEDGVVEGRFPRRGLRLVLEWYTLHQDELCDNWTRAQEHKPLRRIAPLE